MKFKLNIIIVIGIGILILLSGNVYSGTRIIGIDGGMDPDTDSQGQPQETALDKASSALLREAMDAIKKFRPNAAEDYHKSYDDVVNFLKKLECNCGDTLFFVFNGHGSPDGMWFSKEQDPEKRNLEYKEFLKLLEEAKKDCCCKIFILINACHSGSSIDCLPEDEHIKGIYTATSRDTFSYYQFDSLENYLDSWLKRMVDRLKEIDSLNRDKDDKTTLEDALDDAFGKARDKVPAGAWFDGEDPQAFRRDTFAIYGHIRKIIKDGDQNYTVIEVYDPHWRRGELDTIKIKQDDIEKLRKCKWINTKIIYKDPFGIRDIFGPITDAENPKDVLITGHVMAVAPGKVKVHVTWPRHMYCREIWLKNPPEKYVKPDRELPKVPKATRHNREERKRIREEIKRIKEEIKEHKREYKRNARHRKVSVCRWVQQDINITDPTSSGGAVAPLKPFGRYLGGLFHVKRVDRRTGTIRVGSRSGWLKRYGYRNMKIPDSTMAHLDTLFKDRRGRTRPLKYCDNIWITFWLPGSRDSMPEIAYARRVLPHEQSSAEQTSLKDPTIIQTDNSTIIMAEIQIINNHDNKAYDAKLHLDIKESKAENMVFDDSLTALFYLLSATDIDIPSSENIEQMLIDIKPPSICHDWISNRLVSPTITLVNMQKDIYSIFRAYYLQGYMAEAHDQSNTPSLSTWINAYSSTNNTPQENNSNKQSASTQKWVSLNNNYPTTYHDENQFDRAYLHSVLNCNSEPIGQELENVWNNVKSDVSSPQSSNSKRSNNLRTYLYNYLQTQIMASHGIVDANETDCLSNVSDYLTNLALTHSNLYSEGTPSLSYIKLGQTINETLVSNSFKSNSNTQAHSTSPSYHVDILGLPETEQEHVRFEPVQLKAGEKYTALYWRGDRIADEQNKSMNEADLNYEGQEVLSVTFFIEGDNECACPDPNVLQTQAHATGEMTGIVYILHVVNIGESTALCNVGPYLAPGNEKTQTLYLQERHQVSLLPGEEIFIPLQGYCLDHHLLPPSEGTIVDPSKDWINLNTGSLSSPPMNFFSNNTLQSENKFTTTSNRNLLYPGHDKPLTWKYTDIKSVPEMDRNEYYHQLAFLNNQVLSITNRVYDNLYYNDQLHTPLGNTGYAQKELIHQQIFWKFNSTLQNKPYTFDLFHEKAMNEINEELPKSEYKTSAQKSEIEQGLKQIWDQTELIGIKAKLWK